jgi:hypothetical protein
MLLLHASRQIAQQPAATSVPQAEGAVTLLQRVRVRNCLSPLNIRDSQLFQAPRHYGGLQYSVTLDCGL